MSLKDSQVVAQYIRSEALLGSKVVYFDMIEKLVPDQIDWRKNMRHAGGARDILTPEGIEYEYGGFEGDRQFYRFTKVSHRPATLTPTEAAAKPLNVKVTDDQVAGLIALAATLDPDTLDLSGLGTLVHSLSQRVGKANLGGRVATIYAQLS